MLSTRVSRIAFGVGGALVATLACGAPAVAQTPAAPPAGDSSAAPAASTSSEPPSGAASDVVMLKSGGMARGTIMEMDPNGSVSLLLPNGQSRTWPMAEVEYAGPYSRMPERAASSVQRETPTATTAGDSTGADGGATRIMGGKARLRLTSPQRGVTYYAEGAPMAGAGALVDGYVRLCTAPCEVELPEGEYVFALSRGGARPTRLNKPVRVKGEMRLEGTHRSNASSRSMGWVVFGLGLGAGTTLAAWGLLKDPEVQCQGEVCKTNNNNRIMMIVVGGALEAVGLAIGLSAALSRDDVKLHAVVGTPRPLPGQPTSLQTTDPAGRIPWADALSGMSVVGSF